MLLLFVIGNISAHAQIINTIAGDVLLHGSTGDGGPAISAQLQPFMIRIDKGGDLYVSDANHYCIRKISPLGIITTIAGGKYGYSGDGGPATNAAMGSLVGIGLDAAGNIYSSDETNHCVRKINPSGIITTIAGNSGVGGYSGDGGPATAATLWQPRGISADKHGNIYIADHTSNVIRKIDTAGTISTVAGRVAGGGGFGDDIPATTAHLIFPDDVYLDKYDNLYIGDQNDHRIRKVDTFGIIHTYAGGGSAPYSGGSVSATSVSLGAPDYLAMDDTGSLYFLDIDTYQAFRIDTSGILTCIAGTGIMGSSSDGIPATVASLSNINGIAVGCDGTWYISDGYRVRSIADPNTHISFTASSHRITVCENSGPYAVDSFLSVTDKAYSGGPTWRLRSMPGHGTVSEYTRPATISDTLSPSGLSYQPTVGYYGPDSFKIIVSDCGRLYDTGMIYVTVLPHAACATGVANAAPEQRNYVSAWPNPNSGLFNIHVHVNNEKESSAHVLITNIIGTTVKELTVPVNKTIAIDMQQPPGIYFMSVLAGDQRYTVKVEIMP